MTNLEYLESIVEKKLEWVKRLKVTNDTEQTPQEWLHAWLEWCLSIGFAWVFREGKERVGYIIMRPVNVDWVFDTEIDYFENIFHFDAEGDAVWIDSVWAPGYYTSVLSILKATGKRYVGWTHPDKLHFIRINDLCGEHPLKSQIKTALSCHL